MRLLPVLLLLPLGLGCDIPQDPDGTLERVRGGVLRAGATEADPFVIFDGAGRPTGGVEVALIERLAKGLGAEVEWVAGSEEELFSALEQHSVDVVIGGVTSENPWSSKVAFTHPYLTTFATIGLPAGLGADGNITGMRVQVERGTVLEGLVGKLDVEVVRIDNVKTAAGPVAVYSWLLDDLGLEDSGVRLVETDHVMAVAHGENGWLTELERFLLSRPDEIKDLLDDHPHRKRVEEDAVGGRRPSSTSRRRSRVLRRGVGGPS